jgi:hypothetical protein
MGSPMTRPGGTRAARRRRLQQNERNLRRMDLRFMVRPGPAPVRMGRRDEQSAAERR